MNSKTNVLIGNRMSNATRLLFMLVAFAATLCGVYFLATSQRPSAALRIFGQPSSLTPLDACSLTSESEIATVQGVQVQSAQRSSHKQGDLVVAQCYYPAVSSDGRANLSVYLQVIRPEANARRDALKEFWKEQLDRDSKAQRRVENAEEQELEKRLKPPVPISGLGEEAFWLAGRRGGALYVLKQGSVLRVTVGEADVTAQMEKSKALAKKILKRLA
jgi:hypothetical protein